MRLSSFGAVTRLGNTDVLAHPALPVCLAVRSRVNVGVVLGVFVALLAVSPSQFDSSGSRDAHSGSKSAHDVIAVCDGLHVVRVDAVAHAAQMVNVETFRDWLDVKLVGNSVSTGHRSVTSADLDSRVSSSVYRSGPEPATSDRINTHFGQQAFEDGLALVRIVSSGHKTQYGPQDWIAT